MAHPGKPPEFYKAVAAFVTGELAGGNWRYNIALAEAHQVPKTTADRWVRRARSLGFLPPSPSQGGPCRACGLPTTTHNYSIKDSRKRCFDALRRQIP